MLTQVEKLEPIGQVLAQQLTGHVRQHDLTAVRHCHDPRGPVDRRAVIVTVAQLRSSGVDSHPHLQRTRLRPLLAREDALRGRRRADRVVSGREHGVEPVAGRLHDVPVTPPDGLAENLVVARERRLHGPRVLLPQTRRPVEIREEKRDRPGRHLVQLDPLTPCAPARK